MPHKDPEARRAWQRLNYQKNKDVINSRPCKKEAMKRYAKRHIEKRRQQGRERYWKNPEIHLALCKVWRSRVGIVKERKETELLTDKYLTRQLRKDGYTTEEIRKYHELIETKRIILKIKRYEKHQRTT
jgi:hypothetical protein